MSAYLAAFFAEELGLPGFSQANFQLLHIVLELVSIFMAFSIAVQGWLFTRIGDDYKNLIFSSIFFAVGFLDLIHILTDSSMPGNALVLPGISDYFWIIARITETVLFLILIIELNFPLKLRDIRSMAASLSIFYVAAISAFLLLLQEQLSGFTGASTSNIVFNGLMAASTLIHLGIFIHVLRKGRKRADLIEGTKYIAPASLFLVFSSLAISFTEITDFRFLLSLVLKVLGYGFLFVLMFVRYGERPYKEMEKISYTYERFLNSVGEGIYGIDQQGKVTFINASAMQMLGFRRDELLGRLSHSIIHHTKVDGSPYFIEDCPICLTLENNDYTFVTDEVFWRKDGTSFPVEYYTQPIYEDQKITGTIVTFKDVSERKRLKRLEIQHEKIQYEIALAVSVQETLLKSNHSFKESVNVGARSVPFKDLNGDFYAIVPAEEGTTISIADVSGKGIPAAIQMTMMKFALDQKEPVEDILSRINGFSANYMEESSFITMFCGHLDRRTSLFTYASGGHEPVLVYKRKEQHFEELNPTGPILGVSSKARYKAKSVKLEPGDLIILFTDGLVERKKNKEDSNQLIKEAVTLADHSLDAQALTEQIFHQVNSLEPYAAEDDQTLLVLKI